MPTADISEKADALSSVKRAGQIFEKYSVFIRSVIRFHVKSEAEAEDLFQDLFLHLVAKPIPQDVQNVGGYLYRAITQAAKDAFRRIDRYQARIRRYAERNVQAFENCPEKAIMDIDEAKKMFELIERRLPPPQASALTLKYRNGYDTREVAERIGVKPRSVSRYVSVGLKKVVHVFREKQGGNL